MSKRNRIFASEIKPGLEISWSRDPRSLLNSPAAPTNFCWEPNDVLFDIHHTFMKDLGAIWLQGKILILSPENISELDITYPASMALAHMRNGLDLFIARVTLEMHWTDRNNSVNSMILKIV